MSWFEMHDRLKAQFHAQFHHALAEKEKEQKEEKERWTHIESVLNKHISNCLSELEQKDEEISELNDLITKKDEQLKAEKETSAQIMNLMNLMNLVNLSQQNAEKEKDEKTSELKDIAAEKDEQLKQKKRRCQT
jgi:hypothetical protein